MKRFAFSALALALAAFSLFASPAHAARALLELKTDDVAAQTRAPLTNPFPSMTLTLRDDGTLEIQSQIKGRKVIRLAAENYDLLAANVAMLSSARLQSQRIQTVCMALPRDFRDTLSVAQGFSFLEDTPGSLRPVWAQPGCYWGDKLEPLELGQRQRASELVFGLRLLAIEALP